MGFFEASLKLAEGFLTTLSLFFLTLLISVPLGAAIAFLLLSRVGVVKRICEGFVLVVRGTPLMLQLIVIFYFPGLLFGIQLGTRFSAALVAFSINYSCYFSVIFRGAYESVAKGQSEAGAVLGLTRVQVFIHVLLAQIVKTALPAVSNETITLIKDTALARIISVAELLKNAEHIQNLYGVLWPMFYAGLFYLCFNGLVTLVFGYLERKTAFIKT